MTSQTLASIRIHALAGPNAGLATVHAQPRITFGRAPTNTLILDLPHLSRFHGELLLHEGRWQLMSLSPNGVTVNGRNVPANKSMILRPGDVIGVGRAKIFAVQFAPPNAATAVADYDAQEDLDLRPPDPASRRRKLWIAIGIYLALMVVLFAFLAFQKKAPPGDPTEAIEQLTPEQIASAIRQPIRVDRRDERQAAGHLVQAESFYVRLSLDPAARYYAHRHYKLAMAHLGSPSLPGEHQLALVHVQDQLIEHITRDYNHAYALFRNREFDAADRALRDLLHTYPDPSSSVFAHVQQMIDIIDRNRPRRKSFR